MMVNENMKKVAIGGSAIVLAIAMGLQTFVFGQNDLQMLKESVAKLTERVAQLEVAKAHE
jgi:thymidine phosphorylase